MYGEHCPEGERTIYSTQEVGGPCLLGSPSLLNLSLQWLQGCVCGPWLLLPLQTHLTLCPARAPELRKG